MSPLLPGLERSKMNLTHFCNVGTKVDALHCYLVLHSRLLGACCSYTMLDEVIGTLVTLLVSDEFIQMSLATELVVPYSMYYILA